MHFSHVSSLYTNVDTNEGLTIVEEEFEKAGRNNPSAKTFACLLEKVLKLNNFTFNQEHFIQVKGTAMGTRPSRTCIWADWRTLLSTRQIDQTTLLIGYASLMTYS